MKAALLTTQHNITPNQKKTQKTKNYCQVYGGIFKQKNLHIHAKQMPNKQNIKIKKETKKAEYLHKTMIRYQSIYPCKHILMPK